MDKLEKRLARIMEAGADAGGEVVNSWLRSRVDIRSVLHEFLQREIQVKDLDRGLIDFPALIGGKEVFLCWESGEDDIEFWHDLQAGYAGRQRLPDDQ